MVPQETRQANTVVDTVERIGDFIALRSVPRGADLRSRHRLCLVHALGAEQGLPDAIVADHGPLERSRGQPASGVERFYK